MATAGKYPIVKGAATIHTFVERVSVQPAPPRAEGFSLRRWLQASGIRSSNFADVPSWAQFVGLADESGPTDLWMEVRDDGERSAALVAALRGAYAGPLGFAGIDLPTPEHLPRLASYIRTNENVADSEARAAAATMLAGFAAATGERIVLPNAGSPRSASPVGRVARKTQGSSKRSNASAAPNAMADPGSDGHAGTRPISLALNVQVVLPSDATEERYDAMLAAVAKHLGALLAAG